MIDRRCPAPPEGGTAVPHRWHAPATTREAPPEATLDGARAPVAPLLVLAVGNPSRGDDALGPRLLEALHAAGADLDGQVELLGDLQLQIEHVLDLRGRRAVLFVDAARPARPSGGDAAAPFAPHGPQRCASGLTLQRLKPAATLPVLSHALEPAAVLHVAARLGEPMPPSWLLAIEGERFELGAELSAAAQARLPNAVAQARQWISGQMQEEEPPHA